MTGWEIVGRVALWLVGTAAMAFAVGAFSALVGWHPDRFDVGYVLGVVTAFWTRWLLAPALGALHARFAGFDERGSDADLPNHRFRRIR
jgi:hypothetical protein